MQRAKSQVSDTVSKLPLPNSSDRKLYLGFWFVFGCGALAYFIYVAIKCAESYKNPGASIEVDPIQPNLPVFGVCFETGFNDNDYDTPAYDNWEAGLPNALAPNDLPVAIAYWNNSESSLQTERFRYYTDEYQGYCNNGCDCLQFNLNEIKKNKGKVDIYATGAYNLSAERSVAYLFVRPQELGKFKNGTSDEKYDSLNLPSGSYVDASWTVTKRITTTQWAPYKEKTAISYGMVQQVEPLTKGATVRLQKGLATEKATAICNGKAANSTCSVNSFPGICHQETIGDESTAYCGWRCTDGSDIIILGWLCDDVPDCSDGSDEIPSNCPAPFVCGDSQQVASESKCNGVVDCKDSSDEYNCTTLPITISVTVSPYIMDVTIIKSTVTFGWDVALAAFKSVLELAITAMAFLFPAYFLSEPELRRFILRKGEDQKASPASPESAASPDAEKPSVEMKPLAEQDQDQI